MGEHFFSDAKPPSAATLTKKTLKNLIKYGPELARTQQDIQEELEPQNQALQLKLFQQFAPLFSKTGTEIADAESAAGLKRDLTNVSGTGGELVGKALELDKLANPEFYKARETANAGFQSLIGGQDPNKLSGAEMANVERGVNRLNARTGNLNTGDNTTTVSNAMLFGDELGKKRDRFTQSLSLFPGLSAGSRSPIDTFQIGAGRGSLAPNIGNNQFQFNPQQGANIQKFGETAITPLVQQKYDIQAGRRTGADFINQGVSSANSICCFIMIAANDGKELPWWIRFCRDHFYESEPALAVGYKRMAQWLVPLMKKYWLVKTAIKYTMFYPISYYGKYLVGESKFGKIFKPVKEFWFNIWRNYAA